MGIRFSLTNPQTTLHAALGKALDAKGHKPARLTGEIEGKKHDKNICDEEATTFPDGTDLYRDTAYQGHELPNVTVHQPKKKPRNGKVSYEDKESNRLISRIRVVIEHIISGIKRCLVVKDVLRNTKEGYDDVAMELACGPHNYRSHCRNQSY